MTGRNYSRVLLAAIEQPYPHPTPIRQWAHLAIFRGNIFYFLKISNTAKIVSIRIYDPRKSYALNEIDLREEIMLKIAKVRFTGSG